MTNEDVMSGGLSLRGWASDDDKATCDTEMGRKSENSQLYNS